MSKCLWCDKIIVSRLSIFSLFSFRMIKPSSRCEECENALQRLSEGKQCPCCARFQDHEERCRDCSRWNSYYSGQVLNHHSLFHYNSFFKEILSTYKYSCDYRLRHFFAQDLTEALQPYLKIYSCVPIPISEHSFEKRGFNQTTALLDAAGIVYEDILLNQNTSNQSLKTRKERMETTQYFSISEEISFTALNKKYLLIDDVYTTGRTLYHARDILLEAGAEEVRTFSLAR